MYIKKVTHDPSAEFFAEEILAIQYPINVVFLGKIFYYWLPCPKMWFTYEMMRNSTETWEISYFIKRHTNYLKSKIAELILVMTKKLLEKRGKNCQNIFHQNYFRKKLPLK